MRLIFFFLLCVILLNARQVETIVQKDVIEVPSRYGFPVKRKAPVQFNYFFDRTIRWKPRLRVAVAVQNDYLQFTRPDSAYSAGYEVTVSLRDGDKTIIGNTWREQVSLNAFEKTNSRWDYQYHTYILPLHNTAWRDSIPEGVYIIRVDVRVANSSRRYRATRSFEQKREKKNGPEHTEITFLYADSTNAVDPQINPMRDILEFNGAYDAFMRLRSQPGDSVAIHIRLNQKIEDRQQLVQQQFVNKKMHKERLVIQYRLPMEALAEGRYQLSFNITVNGGETISPQRSFQVIWLKKPVYLYHPDLAIRPMRYVLNPEEKEAIKGMNYKELGKWIEKFWEERDPTPETRYNELIDVFFKRVGETVEKFSNRFKEGWQTDRGRIYILYGPPEKIINNRYNTKHPHIIWLYPSRNLRFVFTDKDRDKEFELEESGTLNAEN